MAKKPARYERGGMPDVRLEDREPDEDVLSCGELGPYLKKHGTGRPRLEQMHPTLQEILVRMDENEIDNLSQGLHILLRLEQKDFGRLKTVLKFINLVYGIVRIVKWTVGSFFAGLTAVVLAGDQLQKVWGWILNLTKAIRP